jgi:hypothetical protein
VARLTESGERDFASLLIDNVINQTEATLSKLVSVSRVRTKEAVAEAYEC